MVKVTYGLSTSEFIHNKVKRCSHSLNVVGLVKFSTVKFYMDELLLVHKKILDASLLASHFCKCLK